MLLVELLAEGEGFKPPIPERGIPDFESSAIDHSANSPVAIACDCGCKGNAFFGNHQTFLAENSIFIRMTASIVGCVVARLPICGY